MYSLLTIIISWWIFSIPATILIMLIDGEREQLYETLIIYYGSPKYIHDNSKLNWFGAVVSFLGLFLLFPVYYLILGIYWLCHIRRK